MGKLPATGSDRGSVQDTKHDLALRPIFHQLEHRIEAHIFIAFLAYCLHATLGRRLKGLAPGLTVRSVLEKFSAVQMIDVHVPTTDGRELLLSRYTQPEAELKLLLERLKLALPAQPPPKISPAQAARATAVQCRPLRSHHVPINYLPSPHPPNPLSRANGGAVTLPDGSTLSVCSTGIGALSAE